MDVLRREPRSWLHAAIAGWQHPVSREWIALADLYDITAARGMKRRPQPYPRPMTTRTKKIGGKRTVRRTLSDALAILRPRRNRELEPLPAEPADA